MKPVATMLSSLATFTAELSAAVFDTLFPNDCAACRCWTPGSSGLLCDKCRAAITAATKLPYCPRCGGTVSPLSIFEKNCAHCLRERHWNTAGIARVGSYEAPLRGMILAMKYAGNRRATLALGEQLALTLRAQAWFHEIDALVPVPMHRLRRWQRPCDHAFELAEATAHALRRATDNSNQRRVPVRQAVVRRVRYEESQARATSTARRLENIRDAFAAGKRARPSGMTVCIIDNVITSGATLHEVARILRSAGAKRIYAAVIARASLVGDPRVTDEAIRATAAMLANQARDT